PGREYRHLLLKRDGNLRFDEGVRIDDVVFDRRFRKAEALQQRFIDGHVLRVVSAQVLANAGAGGRRGGEARRQQEIDSEWLVGGAPGLPNASAHLLRRQARAAEDAEPSRVRDSGYQLRRCRHAPDTHAGLDDRQLDSEKIAERRAKGHEASPTMVRGFLGASISGRRSGRHQSIGRSEVGTVPDALPFIPGNASRGLHGHSTIDRRSFQEAPMSKVLPEQGEAGGHQSLLDQTAKVSVIGIFLILIGGVLFFAKDFLLPVSLAFLIALVLSPVVRYLRRRGIPEGLSAL